MLHILTLTWQNKAKIQALKNSLLSAVDNIDYMWHIKDNGSTDGSVEEIRSWTDVRVNLIAYPNNLQNYSQGMNLLFKEASPNDDDIILTLNNDIIIRDSQSIKNMINILQKDANVGIVGAKLNYTDTNKIQHCGVLFNVNNGLPYHYRGGLEEKERDKLNRYYPAVTGAVAALKAVTFANCCENKSGLKGFKEEFFFGFEDIDMSLRIEHFLKKRNVYCGETEIFHEESASLRKLPVHKMFFKPNAKLLLDSWHKLIDVKLTPKYDEDAYDLYRVR